MSTSSEQRYESERTGRGQWTGSVTLFDVWRGRGPSLVHAGAGTIENPLVIVPPTNLLRSEYIRRGR